MSKKTRSTNAEPFFSLFVPHCSFLIVHCRAFVTWQRLVLDRQFDMLALPVRTAFQQIAAADGDVVRIHRRVSAVAPAHLSHGGAAGDLPARPYAAGGNSTTCVHEPV